MNWKKHSLLATLIACAFASVAVGQSSALGQSNQEEAKKSGSDRTDRVAGQSLEDCAGDIRSDDRVVRLRAIRTATAMGSRAGSLLTSTLKHEDPAARFLAAEGLGMIGGESLSEAKKSLSELAENDELTSVRLAAAYALCEADRVDEFLPVMIDAVKYPERGMACYACDMIGRLGQRAQDAEKVLQKVYAANKPGVQGGDYHLGGAAMNALRKIRDNDEEVKQ